MKKLVYTLSFMTVLSLAANAQAKESAKPAAKPVEQQKTVTPAEVPAATTNDQPKSRMAITQKGVPASKAKEKENKDAKAVEPKGMATPAPAGKQ